MQTRQAGQGDQRPGAGPLGHLQQMLADTRREPCGIMANSRLAKAFLRAALEAAVAVSTGQHAHAGKMRAGRPFWAAPQHQGLGQQLVVDIGVAPILLADIKSRSVNTSPRVWLTPVANARHRHGGYMQ